MTRITIGIVSVVAGVALAVFAFLLLDDRSAPPIVISDPRPDATVVVAVQGAVATPGVYDLPGDARVQDALRATGGTTADADLAAINLARRLRDEDLIDVPRRPPPVPPGATPDPAGRPAAEAGTSPAPDPPAAPIATGPIDINRATVAELDTLPGIGPAIAQRIVDYRAANGPFASVDELAEVRGISPRMVDELRPLVTVGP